METVSRQIAREDLNNSAAFDIIEQLKNEMRTEGVRYEWKILGNENGENFMTESVTLIGRPMIGVDGNWIADPEVVEVTELEVKGTNSYLNILTLLVLVALIIVLIVK